VTSYTPEGARDNAIADFFRAATELLRLCKPLVETAIKEKLDEMKPRKRT
jgi:hypothetical protein